MTEVKSCEEIILLESSDKMFRAWMEEVNKVCWKAVFKQQQDVIQQVYEHLEQKEKTFKGTIDQLLIHLEKSSNNAVSSTSTLPPAAPIHMSDAAVQRILASLPPLNSYNPPITAPPTHKTISVPSPFPKENLNGTKGNFDAPPYCHNPSSKNSLPNNGRAVHGRPDAGTVGPLAQLQQLAGAADDCSVVDSDGSKEIIPKKVFLANLARDSDARTIAKYFNHFGPVADVKIFRSKTGESRSFGAVEFADIAGAEKSIGISKHIIDQREVVALPFKEAKDKSVEKPTKRFQVFLGGVPTFLSKSEVETAIRKYCKVRELKLNSERGYGFLDLEDERDVERILGNGYIKIGEKMVECKPNKHN